MHEAAIADSILGIVQARAKTHAKTDDVTLVKNVSVRVGSFRNVDPEALEFAFEGLKQSFDCCQEATLVLHLVQATALCQKNRHQYHPEMTNGFRCHKCHSGMGELLAGNELEVIGCTLSAPIDKDKPYA